MCRQGRCFRFFLYRCSRWRERAARLSDRAISADVSKLEQVRAWSGRPLWEMRLADADRYFENVMRAAAQNTGIKSPGKFRSGFLQKLLPTSP